MAGKDDRRLGGMMCWRQSSGKSSGNLEEQSVKLSHMKNLLF